MIRNQAIALVLLSLVALGSSARASIALAPGDLVLGEQSPTTVHGVDRVSGASRGSCPCSACPSSINDVTVHGTNEIYVTTTSAIVEILASSCASRVVTEIDVPYGYFSGITLDASGALLVTASDCADCERSDFREYGGVLRVDRSSGTQSIVFSGPPMIGPDGLAVAPDGRIYVAAQDTDTVGFDSGVFRIDPSSPAAAVFVAIGDDTAAPIDRTDIISATDIAIGNAAGPLYVLDTRYRGSTLQDELRIIAVNLAGVPTSNQTLLTADLEGVNQDRSSGGLLGIDIAGGTLFTLDHVSSTGSSSDWAGIVSFEPGVSVYATPITDASAFYYPSGLAVVPEPEALGAGVAACLTLMSLLARNDASSR
jgi:hypothetical protein